MPYSSDENNDFVLDTVLNIVQPDSILDVGAGAGKYSTLLRKPVDPMRFDAVEVWEPYIRRFDLISKYDRVYQTDIRQFQPFNYDLVIFGDVLEHISLAEAREVWERVSSQAAWAMISVPIVHYPQGPAENNPHEVHVQEDLNENIIRNEFGKFDHERIFDVTGTFFKQFGEK